MVVELFVGNTIQMYDRGDYYEIPRPDALELIYNVHPVFKGYRDEDYMGLRLHIPKQQEPMLFPKIVSKGYKIKID